MIDLIQTSAAVLFIFSPLLVPGVCFALQAVLFVRWPLSLLVLPVLSGAAAFGWFPSHWNEMARVLYVLDLLGAFIGSALGGILCVSIHWRAWVKK